MNVHYIAINIHTFCPCDVHVLDA